MAGVSEQEKAALSQRRGKLAAGIKDTAKRQAFVKEQGDVDAKGGKDADYATLYNKTGGEENAQALDSYHKGGKVKKTGPALVHEGETVIPKGARPSVKIVFHGKK